MSELILETSFEELQSRFPQDQVSMKLMEFIEPLPEFEGQINEIANGISTGGKLLFLLGRPGTGKSTFIQSLSWRPHLRIQNLTHVDASLLNVEQPLGSLFEKLQKIGTEAILVKDKGPTCVVIDYLENLSDFDDSSIKGFFRKLNGLLRNNPLLIIWPVTQKEDVDDMIGYAREVSGTLFFRSKEVINFSGPPESKFVDIAKRTISVLNDGKELSDFSLTTDALEDVLSQFDKLPAVQRTLREYLELVKESWRHATDYQARIRKYIPKSTEVWFIFSYSQAESVVSQFVRRSHRAEDNWSAIHDKLFEYIHNNNQRSSVWDPKRLQLALYGAIKTRIMFLPTNTLMSCTAAYASNAGLVSFLGTQAIPKAWKDKARAKRSLSRTAVYKQLMGEVPTVGKRKSGPAAVALTQAKPLFENFVDWMVNSGGTDKVANKCVSDALAEVTGFIVKPDSTHPWIPNIIPDLFLDLGHKQICVEFHHTTKEEPGIIADYVLKKLNIYMNQLEFLMKV